MVSAHRSFCCLLLAALSAATLAVAADPPLNMVTSRTNGAHYPLAVALAAVIGNAVPSLRTSVNTARTPVETLDMVEKDRAHIAFTLGDSLLDAWNGNRDAGFETPLRKLRTLAAIYPNYIQIVARADSGIKALADLKGKNVSVGAPRSSMELNARAIFRAAGLTYKHFGRVEYLPFGESVELMKDHRLDATLQSAQLGISALRDLAMSVDMVFLPIPSDVIRRTRDPAYSTARIPAYTYRGQTTDIETAAVQNFIVTRDSVSADTVYEMTKALWTNVDQLVAAHPAAKAMAIRKALDGIVVPLHAGAEKYYREVGVLK